MCNRFRVMLLVASLLATSCGTTRNTSGTGVAPGSEREIYLEMFARGYVPGRSGQIFFVPERGHFMLVREDSVYYRFMHGSPWDYDAEIPLLFYGDPFIRKGTRAEAATQQDIAPTILTLLKAPVPTTMTGHPLTGAIAETPKPPKAVVVIVLDGMGRATWKRLENQLPEFARLRQGGAWFENARLNYLPSVTSAGHASIATGTDPRFHGIQANDTYDRRTGKVSDPFPDMNPANYQVLTLADYWNLATPDSVVILAQGATPRATVALAGHGACTFNGRKTVMVMFDEKTAGWTTNTACFRLPGYLADHDAKHLYGTWMGHTVDNAKRLLRSGLYPAFQMDALLETIDGEHVGKDAIPDLLLVNIKTPDYVAHQYGPASREMEEALRSIDAQLGRLVAKLEGSVGSGQYVLAITADHGMPPEPTKDEGGRHYTDDFVKIVNAQFDGVILNLEDSNCQMYVDQPRLASLNHSLHDVAKMVEALPFIRFAYSEDEIRAARVH